MSLKLKSTAAFLTVLFFSLIFMAPDAQAASRYVDSAVSTSGNGQSWATAWKTFAGITGLQPGDTVYISGGPAGSSKTYSVTSVTPFSGSAGNPITYKIGQEAGHNGTAIFNASGTFVNRSYVVVSGDAGDGRRHFNFSSGGRILSMDNGYEIRVSYVDCGSKRYGFHVNGGSKIEIDNIYFKKIDGGDDRFAYLHLSGSTWDVNKVHDCTIELIRSNSGTGDDGIQAGGGGISIYNNRVIGYLGSYTGGQHQDGWQGLHGNYIKIYNNYWQDIANYPIFGDAYYGDFKNLWIYNNVLAITSSLIQQSAPPQGIAVGPDGGSYNQLKRWPTFDNVVIANNTIVDYGGHACVNLRNNPGQSATFTNCNVSNNICLNGGGFGIESGIVNANNIKTSNTSNSFVSYSPLSASNDLHLNSGDTLFKDKGTNLSAYFSIDKDGKSRTAPWDIGAYEYGGTAAPASYCGDKFCNNGETCSSCPGDCGACQPVPSCTGCIEAESGTLASPMAKGNDSGASGGQYIETNTADSGTAGYSFNITTPGTYKFTAKVFAATAGNDSFYFKLDNNAEDTWDLNPAGDPALFNKWIELDMNKRGNGTFDKPQYQPYTAYLNAGSHTLSFRGREAGTKLDYFKPVQVGTTAKKGDLNNDGKVDVTDLGMLLGNWGATSRPGADINQDGRVDVTDLGVLLGNWG